jgi:hypothetical protein
MAVVGVEVLAQVMLPLALVAMVAALLANLLVLATLGRLTLVVALVALGATVLLRPPTMVLLAVLVLLSLGGRHNGNLRSKD